MLIINMRKNYIILVVDTVLGVETNNRLFDEITKGSTETKKVCRQRLIYKTRHIKDDKRKTVTEVQNGARARDNPGTY
jgi:hypothetical protein